MSNNPKEQDIFILNGDCAIELKKLKSNSVDLIITSPPYADQRTGRRVTWRQLCEVDGCGFMGLP